MMGECLIVRRSVLLKIPELTPFDSPSIIGGGGDIDLSGFSVGPHVLFFHAGTGSGFDSIRAYSTDGTLIRTVPFSDIPGAYVGSGNVGALYVVMEGLPGSWTFRDSSGTALFSGVNAIRFCQNSDVDSTWGYGIAAKL